MNSGMLQSVQVVICAMVVRKVEALQDRQIAGLSGLQVLHALSQAKQTEPSNPFPG
jgi:hypothetical protein